jgi:hypothetical protein
LFGGLAVTLGFTTPFASAVLMAVLANAALVVHGRHGLWNTAGGFEYPLALIGSTLALGVHRPWSVQPGPPRRLDDERARLGLRCRRHRRAGLGGRHDGARNGVRAGHDQTLGQCA